MKRTIISGLACLAVLVSGTLGCKGSNSVMTANDIFESELRKRGISFSNEKKNLYTVDVSGTPYTVSTENIGLNFNRDHDEAAVVRFVEQVLSPSQRPSWEQAKALVFFAAEPGDYDFRDTLRDEVTETVRRVLVLTDLHEGKVTWLSPSFLSEWKVSKEEVEKAAAENLNRLLAGKRPEVKVLDGMKLGMVPVASVFKASVIFAPNFKSFVSPDLGWPVLAVIPCRDFIYVIPEKDRGLLNRMGGVVDKEYRGSGYPITLEVLRISDEGIKAIGSFAPPGENEGSRNDH